MALISNAILTVLLLTATAVLLPKLTGAVLGLVFRGVGWLIWRRTRSRREYVIARARSEEQESRASRPKASTNSLPRNGADDEDWEKVDSLGPGGVQSATSSESSGSAGGNKDRNSDDWDGIIGFFHPFWYGHSPQHVNASAHQ
jgi:alpha-1,2-mannosyltransferase